MFKNIKYLVFISLLVTVFGCNPPTSSSTINSSSSSSIKTLDEIIAEIETKKEDVPTTSTTCVEQEVVEGWVPVWCEEFNYEGLPNDDIWSYQVGTGEGGWGNGEEQYYSNARLDNASVKDGKLTITAKKESYNGSPYSSARIRSINKADFKYGRFDIKAKMPRTGGTWPAIWMMPTESVYGGWPNSGEIDIAESTGNNVNRFMGTVHMGAYYSKLGNQKGSGYKYYTAYSEFDLINHFHTYSIIWEQESITWLFDNIPYYTLNASSLYQNSLDPTQAWPFDQKFHFILNIAIGGAMGGNIDPNFTVDTLEVDYIRVYQKDYVSNDNQNPAKVNNLRSTDATQKEAFIRWDKSSDDVKVKTYHLILNNEYVGSTDGTMYKLSNLAVETNYTIIILAEDYNGKLSEVESYQFSTASWPSSEETIYAKNFFLTINKQAQVQLSGGIYHLGYLSKNDAFKYRINIPLPGLYKVEYVVAASLTSKVELYDGQSNKLATTTLSPTGGYSSFQTKESTTFNLDSGMQDFLIKVIEPGFNFRSFKITKVG